MFSMVFGIFLWAINALLALASVVAVVQILSTRADAFDAADRRPRNTWAGIMGVVAFIMVAKALLGSTGFGLLSLVSCIILGIYFFDVRPSIKDVLTGQNNYW